MPYLPIDMDGRKDCAKAANYLQVHPGVVSWALQEIWDHVWRAHFLERSPDADVLSEVILFGCIGELATKPKAVEALVEFGFLERVERGLRVRGAKAWLFGLEAKSRGGHAAKKNLIPGGKKARQPRSSRRIDTPSEPQSSAQPIGSAESLPIGTSSAPLPTVHSPVSTVVEKPAGKQRPPPDPRHAPLVKALCDAAPGYAEAFDGRDARQVTLLLAKGSPEEVLVRWRRALARNGYPLVRTLSELVTNWHHFATGDPPRKGAATAADKDHSTNQVGPDGELLWGTG